MTTWVTEDRILAEKDGSFTINVEGGTVKMNEPVAWARQDGVIAFHAQKEVDSQGYKWFPLYTHPVKEQKCVVQNCENHKHEGSFNGDLCSPCYQFIAHGKGIYSQAYRNTHSVKELTDEEINEIFSKTWLDFQDYKDFARAILRKAQEK
jgi:hypothetical protein